MLFIKKEKKHCLKPSTLVISDSEVLQDAALKSNKCNAFRKSGTLKFVKKQSCIEASQNWTTLVVSAITC